MKPNSEITTNLDPKAFIFSIDTSKIFRVKPKKWGVFSEDIYIGQFESILIPNHCQTKQTCVISGGKYYYEGLELKSNREALVGGKGYFKVIEIEVYQLVSGVVE